MKTATGPIFGDEYLESYRERIEARRLGCARYEKKLLGGKRDLAAFALGHDYFGLHFTTSGVRLAEWAPNAEGIFLVGDFNGWQRSDGYAFRRVDERGVWELDLDRDALSHGDHYLLDMSWPGGGGERIPAYARRVVQDENTRHFAAQVWNPPKPYRWRNDPPGDSGEIPRIYEAHVGMAQERPGVGTYEEFRSTLLPRIAEAGYDTIQLMAIMEHPYYGSFGYQVSNFFAASSRFGTPEELKALVDDAHGLGLRVIMDLVHSHGVRNEREGLGSFDGTRHQYFHEGARGEHPAWDSYLFDYSKSEVVHFLLSNCRFWLDEYRFDGYRIDGVTSMLYLHHGLNKNFVSYDDYFGDDVDEDALCYLTLANKLIHQVKPGAITIAEDVSGMPGLGAPPEAGGAGFDYRMAMGVSDCIFKLTDIPDEDWDLGWLWHELTNRRAEESTVSYVECHDQALVGGKSLIFTLADASMYGAMSRFNRTPETDRAVALSKLFRLAAFATSQAYLNFMGNEFGHPEWIDFPREGNGWSYHYARRQWSLADDGNLLYGGMALFDGEMLKTVAKSKDFSSSPPRTTWYRRQRWYPDIQKGRAGLLLQLPPVGFEGGLPLRGCAWGLQAAHRQR